MTALTQRQQTIKINKLIKVNENLLKEVEFLRDQLKWSRIESSQEAELKNACFFFLTHKGLYTEWSNWHNRRTTERILDEIKKTFK